MTKKILSLLLALFLMGNVAAMPVFSIEMGSKESVSVTSSPLEAPGAVEYAQSETRGGDASQDIVDTRPPNGADTSYDESEQPQPTQPTVPTSPNTEPPVPDTEPTAPSTEPTVPSTEPTQPSVPVLPESVIPTALEIDTENIYEGMDKAYEDGYVPQTANGTMQLVLPLLSNGSIYENKIKVSLGLGTGASSPFVIANYEKTFELETVMPKNSKETKELFLVEFAVKLSSERINGVYPVSVNISGYDDSGNSINCMFTIYVTITDGKSDKVIQPSPEVATAEPVVYISNSVIRPDKVMAGEEFTLTLTLKNSLDTKSVKNMLVQVDTGNLQINLHEDTNVFQVDKIPADGETELTIRFRSDASIPAGKYNLSFSFRYDSSKTLNLSSSGSVIVEIRQPANMELVVPRFPEQVTVGETIPLSLQVMNMGRDSMFNVRCIVSGFGFSPSNTGFIGTMNAGSSAATKVELYIIALNASKGNENGNQYGNTTGTVTLIYEDDTGEEFRQETQFETEVRRPIAQLPQSQDTEEVEERASVAWWFAILILGGVAVAALVGGLVIKHKSSKVGRYL